MVALVYSAGAVGGERANCVAASRTIWLMVMEFRCKSSRKRLSDRIVATGNSVLCATRWRKTSTAFVGIIAGFELRMGDAAAGTVRTEFGAASHGFARNVCLRCISKERKKRF